jgi:hypothetical protein
MSTKEERQYISEKLMPEIRQAFEVWAREYQQERDLGKLGEFANLYRKARKLKTLWWDPIATRRPNTSSTSAYERDWREDDRTITLEIIAHGLLMLADLDKESGDFEDWMKQQDEDEDEDEDEEPLTGQGVKAQAIGRKEYIRGSRLRQRAARANPIVGGNNGQD